MITRADDPRALKNTAHEYMLVNQQFINMLNVPSDYRICGQTHDQLPLAASQLAVRLHEHEKLVMKQLKQSKAIVSFAFGNMRIPQILKLVVSPFYDDEGSCAGTLLEIRHFEDLSADFFTGSGIPHQLFFNKPSDSFTVREWEIIFLISLNIKRKDISSILGTSTKAVEHCIASCLRKTGCKNGTELVDYGISNGWYRYVPPRFRTPRYLIYQ